MSMDEIMTKGHLDNEGILPKLETYFFVQASLIFVQCILWTLWLCKDTQTARRFTVLACQYGVFINVVFLFYQIIAFGLHDSEAWMSMMGKLLTVCLGFYYVMVA